MQKLQVLLLILSATQSTVSTEQASIEALHNKARAIVNRLYRHEVRSRVVDEVTTKALRTIASLISDQNRRLLTVENNFNQVQTKISSLESTTNAQNKKLDRLSEVLSLIQNDLHQNNNSPSEPVGVDQHELNMCGNKANAANTNMTLTLERLLNPLAQTQTAHLQELLKKTVEISDRVSGLEASTQSLISRGENTTRMVSELFHTQHQHQIFHNALNSEIRNSTSVLEKRLDALHDMLSGGSEICRPAGNGSGYQETLETPWVTIEVHQSAIKSIRNDIITLHANLSEDLVLIRQKMNDVFSVEDLFTKTNESIMRTGRQLQYGLELILTDIQRKSSEVQSAVATTMFTGCAQIMDQLSSSQEQSLRNVTSSVGKEIAQIWRQLGAISSMFRESVEVLERIDARTSQYINGSIISAEKVRGTVRHVAERVDDVENDLNYLLGRLSLVVSEFGLIRTSLIDQLANMRKTFRNIGSNFSSIQSNQNFT